MFRYFRGLFLIFAVLITQFAFAEDNSGSTKLSVAQCYEGEDTKYVTGCIPGCVCVTADNCPCCTIGDILAILNPERQEQNETILASVEKLRAMESWELDERRRTTIQVKEPTTSAEKHQYFTDMALMFLPDDRLRKIGIKTDGSSSTGINIPFEYIANSACWWGGVAGGGDVVEVGEDCKGEWID